MPTFFAGKLPTEDARKNLEEAFQHMDNFLQDQNWFAGDHMTIADFSLFSPFSTVVVS